MRGVGRRWLHEGAGVAREEKESERAAQEVFPSPLPSPPLPRGRAGSVRPGSCPPLKRVGKVLEDFDGQTVELSFDKVGKVELIAGLGSGKGQKEE